MIDITDLPPKERAQHYRKMAVVARREADSAQADMRDSYVIISDQWERLAIAADSDAGPQSWIGKRPGMTGPRSTQET